MIDAGLPPARHASIGALTALALAVALVYPASAAMAATYTVDTAGDPGPTGTLSLRRAVQLANNFSGDTVQFDPSLVGSTISLDNGAIAITGSMTIAGLGADRLAISGKNATRVFSITGGAVATLSGLTLTQGRAPVNGNGGAIYSSHASLTLRDSVISASTASIGGGVFVGNGNATIDGSRILGNVATANGGGLAAYDDLQFEVTHSTISGNNGGCYGGGISAFETSNISVNYSLISNNSLGQPAPYCNLVGGGIRVRNHYVPSTARIVNSTVTGNYGYGAGGGIDFVNSSIATWQFSITQSTITHNASSVGNSGSGVYASPGGSVSIVSSIVANNSSRDGDFDLTGNFSAVKSLIKTRGSAVITGSGNTFDQDPQLGPLRDNGGPTLTMLPAFESPVIDAGLFDSSLVSDQRGLPRNAPVGHADMGAVERQYPEDFIFRNGFD